MNAQLRQCFSAVVSGDGARLEQSLPSVNVNEGSGEHTLLHAAAENGNATIVRLLINWKADFNALDKNGMTPLQVSIERQHWEAYQLLKQAGTDLEISDKSGARALHWAVQSGSEQITRDLLQSKVNVAPKAKFDSIPLHLAARVGSVPIIKLLIQYRSPLETPTKGHTALHIAAMKGFSSVAQELIDGGALIECKNNRNWTPLHMAASTGKTDTFTFLINNNADLHAMDSEGNTPADLARSKGYNDIVEAAGNPPVSALPDSSVALALHPYNKSIFKDLHRQNDLSFTAGTVITNIKEDESGWWEGSIQNESGTFPSNYVSNTPIGKAKCIHNYYASKPDEMNIKKGDDIAIYERRPSGWLRVICNGSGGLVPPTHIREMKSTPVPIVSPGQTNSPTKVPYSSSAPKPKFNANLRVPSGGISRLPVSSGPPPATTGPPPMPATNGPPPMPSNTSGGYKPPQARPAPAKPAAPPTPKARVLYPYAAQHPGDLELSVGNIVELTKTEGGWWEGIYNGARGIFPANYVERI